MTKNTKKKAAKASKSKEKTKTSTPLKQERKKKKELQASAEEVLTDEPQALQAEPELEVAEAPDLTEEVDVELSDDALQAQAAEGEVIADDEDVVLKDAEGRSYCKVRECDELATVEQYCRLHYLLHWKKIQLRKKILADGKLDKYIEELTTRYPDKYVEIIRKDLKSEKDFLGAIQELEIDDLATETEFEDDQQSLIEEVRGVARPRSDDDEF